MPNQTPLNPDAIHQLFAVAMMEVLDAEKLQPGDRLAHVNDIQEVLNRLEKNVLAVAQPEVNSVDSQSTPEGHYDAWLDTGDGYTQRKGWTLTCLWCGSEFTGATKSEALKGYRGHEESIMRALREADAERAKNRPTVNDA